MNLRPETGLVFIIIRTGASCCLEFRILFMVSLAFQFIHGAWDGAPSDVGNMVGEWACGSPLITWILIRLVVIILHEKNYRLESYGGGRFYMLVFVKSL